MKGNKLAARLGRVREGRRQRTPKAPSQSLSPGPGWEAVSDFVWRRCTREPLSEAVRLSMERTLFRPDTPSPEALCFYDLETTGLSGGAGTRIFLAGFLFIRGDYTEAVQLFLSDYPGEAAFLEEIRKLCSPDLLYVSYNGKSFDRHLLISRAAFNGVQLSMPRQLDLLYPARRLWRRRLESCSLSRVEEEILDIVRDGDIPGALIPERYFTYLKTADPGLLGPVFAHHLQDLLSLLMLLSHLEKLIQDPVEGDADELCGLGRLLLAAGQKKGCELLIQSYRKGSIEGGRHAVVHLKRLGRRGEACDLAASMWEERASLFAAVELAKFYEHDQKEYQKALDLLDQVEDRCRFIGVKLKQRLAHRRERLERRLYRSM